MKKQKENIARASKRNQENRKWYLNYLKQWKLNNPEYMPEYNKEYYDKNTEKFYEKLKRWQELNPERSRYYNRKKRHHTINKQEWNNCKEYFNNSCAYCGLPIDKHICRYKDGYRLEDLHKEHKDDEGSNTLDNCVPSCKSCNSEKGSYDFEVWYCEDNPKFVQERYDIIIKWITEDYKLYIKPTKPKGKYIKKNRN